MVMTQGKPKHHGVYDWSMNLSKLEKIYIPTPDGDMVPALQASREVWVSHLQNILDLVYVIPPPSEKKKKGNQRVSVREEKRRLEELLFDPSLNTLDKDDRFYILSVLLEEDRVRRAVRAKDVCVYYIAS